MSRVLRDDETSFTLELDYMIDEFDELQDLRWSELQFLNEYKELKMKKNDGLPINQAKLDELELIFSSKIVTSARWNKFQNALMGMQTFIKTDVNNYIDTEIGKFQYRGTYNPSVQYFQRNVVDFNDGASTQAYIATKDVIGIKPTVQTHWTKLTIQGPRGQKGLDGVGLKFKGRYEKTKVYAKDDGVQFGGAMFASLVEGNIDNEPNLSADTAYWAKALDVTVTVSGAVGVRTVATDTDTVNFITGEIVAFNKDVDTLEVYQNSVRLTKGIDYEIGLGNQTIVKKVDIWKGSTEPIFFEFFVIRNQINDLVFSDGQSIANGTVTESKLEFALQEKINEIPIVFNIEKPTNGAALWFEEIV